jgi:hypothetical protein
VDWLGRQCSGVSAAILGAKAMLAVMLVVAGGAKLADLSGFAATVRLFLPPVAAARPWSAGVAGRLAAVAAGGELLLGAASLSSPGAAWLNAAVLGVACSFVAVSGAGYAFHRGRSCRCFGALSQRRFDLAGIGRAVLIAGIAAVAVLAVPGSLTRLTLADRGLLLAGAALLACLAFTAARYLAASGQAMARRLS